MLKNQYDYIICGGGASGLLLAYRMCNDPYFKDRSLLLIEKDPKDRNDRTWCFWESGEGDLEAMVHKTWNHAYFNADDFEMDFSLQPFRYKMIRSLDFYQSMKSKLAEFDQLTQIKASVSHIKDGWVTTEVQSYQGGMVFSSIYNPKSLSHQKKYPVLLQHFVGQVVQTQKPCFDPDKIEFMNFKVPQKGNTRFMYVLPLGRNKALLEYTLFSQNVLERKEYKDAIADFLKELPTGGYEILEEEEGKIPMTCYRFDLKNNSKLLHIGTAGGWTKPSTGYTFQRINEKTKELVDFLKKGQPLSRFGKRTRFWFYDLLFIDVLAKDNANGAKLFKKMFEKNSPEVIFQFLDEKSTLWQEFQIMRSFDVGQFVKALLKRLF
ncbi:MAG: lycopene cyclase [Bacteroidetes bacterium]|jgi:lycopene beta-cyclase|nr:lycopene cyclase [Flavobacteriaceae bacterium]MDG1940985.1 lycopene cyclase family protein [Flavobacteriaceae bacterium]NCF31172.1 lycopene cyclase [Bacteroidota bacterium]